jgi:putative peptidoglycan lipid II flippase
MKKIALGRSFLTVGGWTMISRVLGVVREVMIAATLGAGPVAEAFLVAFSLPNMFRRFFAEGAFNMAFVPLFSKKLERDDSAQEFASDAFSILASILIVFTLIAQLAMPLLVSAMASGFIGDGRFDLAVDFGVIVFPYILFISLAALLSGVLNASGRFTAAAAAPTLLNVFLVLAMYAAHATGRDVGLAMAWTVPFAGAAQMALVYVAAKRAGFRITIRLPKITPDLKRLGAIAVPAALAGGVVQINLLVGRQVASFFDGAVAWLYYADRLYQLPLGVVGIAIGIVLLPDLSRKLSANDVSGSRETFNRATEFALSLTLPAAIALAVIPMALIHALFERGAFTSNDSLQASYALAIYAAGLPAFVLQKILQPLFFAREDTKSPFYYAMAAMVINAGIAIGLAPVIGFLSAAYAATIAAWAMVLLLWLGSRKMGAAAQIDSRLVNRTIRTLLASIAMGIVLYLANTNLSGVITDIGGRYINLAVLISVGLASYVIAGLTVGAFKMSELRRKTS